MCYDRCAFPKKRRGVNVKGEPRLRENIFLILLIIIDIYLLGLNISSNEYEINKKETSTANYVSIDEIIESNTQYEISVIDKYEEEKQEIEPVVYDGMTLDELADKINRSLNSTISGKGYLIASHSLEMGVDPYMATAIMLHETGCTWTCSKLARTCNNVAGNKGKPGCNGGSYRKFDTIEEGIKFAINKLNSYYKKGYTTPKEINPYYATDKTWYKKVENYMKKLKK